MKLKLNFTPKPNSKIGIPLHSQAHAAGREMRERREAAAATARQIQRETETLPASLPAGE